MFRSFIDESEIEEWFEEEKTKLNNAFYEASFHKKNVEQAKKTFDTKFSQLLKRYDKEFENLTKRAERKKKLRKPWEATKHWALAAWARAKKHWKIRKELRAKKKFDKEYERLMKE